MFVFNGVAEFISIILRDDEREIIKSFWYDLRNDIALTDNFNYDIFPLKRDMELMKHYCKMLNFLSHSLCVLIFILRMRVLFGEFTLRPGNFYKGWRIPKVNKNILELFSERMENNMEYPHLLHQHIKKILEYSRILNIFLEFFLSFS